MAKPTKVLMYISTIIFFCAFIFPVYVLAAGPGIIGASSEWEATGFNNGRRMVRDSNGYFHAFWHSKPNLPSGPSGDSCHIFYSYTTTTAIEPPSMANQLQWAAPIDMTQLLAHSDDRYPSVAIEYDIYDNDPSWRNTNKLHVVWQGNLEEFGRYEIFYANVPVTNPPTAVTPWLSAMNLSNTTTDSLVPAIAINQADLLSAVYQHIHVVWQEEDVNNGGGTIPGPAEDNWASDIAYIMSTTGGAQWTGLGGWNGHTWANLSQTTVNSQMPSIACILDKYTGNPAQTGRNEMGYNSQAVHVAYNEDTDTGIQVYYIKSNDNGFTWAPRIGMDSMTSSAYPNIAVEMMDNPHMVYMSGGLQQREPMRNGPAIQWYLAGINPSLDRSFPGPAVGMYGVSTNQVAYASTTGAGWYYTDWSGSDEEFPTVAFDRWQHVNVNWQDFLAGDYEIRRATRNNTNVPSNPVTNPVYGIWSGLINDSNDPDNDDLFPNLAERKTAMYKTSDDANIAGYDEVWTKIIGHEASAAIASTPMKLVMQDGNVTWLNPTSVPLELSEFVAE